MRNHLGSYECKLCLTLHTNEGSYLAHTQGKKHQDNLKRRAAKEAAENPQQPQLAQPRVDIKKFIKIGRPGYKVTKQRDPNTQQNSLLFQVDYPEIADDVAPRHRFMSAFEQKLEAPDKAWQYLLVAAEPYETISFKVLVKLFIGGLCLTGTTIYFLKLTFIYLHHIHRFQAAKLIRLTASSGHSGTKTQRPFSCSYISKQIALSRTRDHPEDSSRR